MTIELRKSNYGGEAEALLLRFNKAAGCFVSDCGELPSGPLDRATRESNERAAVLELIRKADAKGDPMPAATRGERSAHAFAEARGLPEALRGKRGKARFYQHIETLRADGVLQIDPVRRANRNYSECIRPASCTTERASATEQASCAKEQHA